MAASARSARAAKSSVRHLAPRDQDAACLVFGPLPRCAMQAEHERRIQIRAAGSFVVRLPTRSTPLDPSRQRSVPDQFLVRQIGSKTTVRGDHNLRWLSTEHSTRTQWRDSADLVLRVPRTSMRLALLDASRKQRWFRQLEFVRVQSLVSCARHFERGDRLCSTPAFGEQPGLRATHLGWLVVERGWPGGDRFPPAFEQDAARERIDAALE